MPASVVDDDILDDDVSVALAAAVLLTQPQDFILDIDGIQAHGPSARSASTVSTETF
jgi:hypothetical protein